MASYARDIFFAVRVEDRATRPLRRIARDFQSLGRAGLRQRIQVAEQARGVRLQAEARQMRAQANLAEIQQARTAAAMADRRVVAQNKETAAKLKSAGVDKQINDLGKQRITNANRLGQIEAALAQRRTKAGQDYNKLLEAAGTTQPAALAKARKGILEPRFTAAQLAAEQEKVLIAQRSLIMQEDILASKAGLAAGALERQREATSALGQQEAVLAQREAALTAEVEAATIARSQAIAKEYEANAAVRRFPLDRLAGIATYIRHVGQVMTTFGVVAVAGFALAGKAAADFATQSTLAATQSTLAGNNTVAQVQRNSRVIQSEIQKLLASGRVISGPSEQTRAAYEIFSGIRFTGSQASQLRQGITLLKEFNRVTVANVGLVTLEESTRAGIILINRFGLSLRQIPKALNTMQAAVRFGKLTMSEFVTSLNQAAPAAQAAGYTFPQMASAVAFLSKQFPSLRMGVTGYARLLEILARPDIIQALKQHGVVITQVRDGVQKLLPIQQIAANIIAKFGGNVKQGSIFLQNFFKSIGGTTQGTIQARRVLTAYLQHLGQASKVLRDVTGDNNELAKSQRAAQLSPGVRLQEFINQMRAFGIAVGQGVIPAVANLAPYVAGLARWFQNLSPHTKRLIGYFGALTAVVVLLGGVLAVVVGAFGQIGTAIAGLLGAKGVGALAAETGAAQVRFLALFGVVGPLLFVLLKYPQVFSSIADAVGGTANALKLLTTYFIAFTVARRAGIFSGLIASANEAVLSLATLRAALISLGAFGALTITIGLLLDPNFRQKAHDWMHRRVNDFKKFGNDVASAFTMGQVEIFSTSEDHARAYWDKQFREYQQAIGQMQSRVRNIAGRRNISAETAQLQAPTVDPNMQASLRQRLSMLRNQLRTESVFQRPQTLRAIAHIQTQLDMPRNIQATIRRAQSMAKLRLPLDTRALNAEIANISVSLVRAIGIRIPTALQAASRRAVRYFNNITQAAQAVGRTKITPDFQQLFRNLIKARRLANEAAAALKLDPSPANQRRAFNAWSRYQQALKALEASGDKDRVAAAKRTAAGLGQQTRYYSDQQVLAEARKVRQLERAAKNQNTFAAWKRYYAALNALQKHATDAQMQAVDQILNVTTSKVNQTAEKARETINTILSNLQSMYNDFLQRNQEAFGQLFQGPFEQSAVIQDKMAYGYKLTARDMLRDLRSQITQFRQFNKELALLQRRGAPPELINQLRQLGPTALPQIRTLERSSPRVWRAYIAAFNQSQRLIKEQTMRDLRSQLRLYRQQGKNIALAILSGLQTQDQKLIRWFRQLIAQMFPGLTRRASGATRQQQPRRREITHTRRTATQARRATAPARRSTTRRARDTTRRQPGPTRRGTQTQRRPTTTKQYTTMSYVDDAPSRNQATRQLQNTARTHAATMRDMHAAATAHTRQAFTGGLGYFRNYGRRVGLAILAGLRTTTPQYQRWLRNALTLPDIAPQAPPPRRVQRELQRTATPVVERPPARPRATRILEARRPHRFIMQPRIQPMATEKKVEYHDHFHITAPRGEHDSVLKQAKHAAWHAKTRHRHRD